jgi:gliding motility-associated protein GldC
MKESEIKLTIRLDDENVPEVISWSATDSGMEGVRQCRAMMLSIWDPKENSSMRIDLWTKDMVVEDMQRFIYENFVLMADTYLRATKDNEATEEIKKFAEAFSKKTGIKS